MQARDFGRVGPLFRGHKQHLPVFTIIEGSFPGRVFVDDADAPATALVWAVSRWAYIGGSARNDRFCHHLPELLVDTVIPDSRRMGMNWFELYAVDSAEWMATIERAWGAYGLEKHYETVYTLDECRYRERRRIPLLPEGVWIESADLPILDQAVRNSPFIAEAFKRRTALGFRLLREGEVLSVCQSNGFASGNEFMVDVLTVDREERGKGYATAVGTALVDHCLEHGLRPVWETTFDNLPSQKLARRLGFVADESYPVYAMEF